MTRRLVIEADGGSRGNPGVAGFGALVRDADTGALLAERAEPLGLASNNVAEYSGLIAGLTAAYAVAPGADIEVRMDSKLVIEQMAGRWKIKHEDMRRLALEARDVVGLITAAGGRVRWTWIPRERNKAADALSNIGMDGESVDRTFSGEPAADAIPPAPDPAEARHPSADGFSSVGPDGQVRRSEPARILLVRHGVTRFTLEGRLDGRGGSDPELDEQGLAQAANAARVVSGLLAGHEARVVTSSLLRARQTGGAVADALGLRPEVDPDLDEQGFGDWDGASFKDLLADHRDELARLRDDTAYARPGGESHDEMATRVLAAFDRVVAAGGRTVLVCHRKPIMVILGHLLGMPAGHLFRLAAAPGSVSGVEVWPHGEVVVAFTNRT